MSQAGKRRVGFAVAPPRLRPDNRFIDSKRLYEWWAEVAAQNATELALADASSGRRWTFSQLFSAGDQEEEAGIAFPQGSRPEFIIDLLRTWRAGGITCPLEPGQERPPGIRVGEACPPTAEPETGSGPRALSFPACAHLKLTSASTGTAKCVVFTASQLAADARNIVTTMGLRPDLPNLGTISLAHSYGFSNLVLPLLLHGVPLILAGAPLPEAVLAAARGFQGVTLAAVPALWRTWFESESIPPNTRIAISAGAPLPIELEGAVFRRLNLKIHNFYGSTECGGIAYDRTEAPREDPTLAGTALDGVCLSVSNGGTLVVQSDAVGITYWPEPRDELRGGRFITSDLVEIVDGSIHLRGRTSELINVAGRKVAPEQIEAVLRRHPRVKECVVFGVPAAGHERFEIIAAVLNGPADVLEMQAFLSTELPGWQIPRQWYFTDQLAPNARGKISRAEWRQKFLLRL